MTTLTAARAEEEEAMRRLYRVDEATDRITYETITNDHPMVGDPTGRTRELTGWPDAVISEHEWLDSEFGATVWLGPVAPGRATGREVVHHD